MTDDQPGGYCQKADDRVFKRSNKNGMMNADKQKGNTLMFYVSAMVAIIGAVGYQYFVKRVPASLNPVVSVIGIYVSVLMLSAILLLFFPVEGGLVKQLRQLSWIQLVIAISVFMIEIGFLLMYRYGWNLSTANLVTGVFINIVLVG